MKHRSLFSVIINLNKIKQERLTPMYKNYTTPTNAFELNFTLTVPENSKKHKHL